jgi:hypothetical protein
MFNVPPTFTQITMDDAVEPALRQAMLIDIFAEFKTPSP